jgi:hypothetical protein
MIREVLRDDALHDDRIELLAMPTDKREVKSWNIRGSRTVTEIRGFDMMDI